jgi:regulator of replication initiation timing/DNA-binding PadR family transcriptional regulator
MIETTEAPKKIKLIDHVRAVLTKFPPKYIFGAQNIFDALDAAGVDYNKGGLKSGVVPTLIRNGEIYVDTITDGAPGYRRTAPIEKQKPKKNKRHIKPHIKATPTLIALALVDRPLSIDEIAIRIEHKLKLKLTKSAIYQALLKYKRRGLVTCKDNPFLEKKVVEYQATEKLFSSADHIRASLKKLTPHLSDQIDAALDAYARKSNAISDEVERQEKKAKTQNPNQPIDWDLPENCVGAADLGAAFYEYMRRLNRQLGAAPKGKEAEKVIAKLKYDADELKARIFTRTNQVNGLERENKRLKSRLDSLINENKNLADENQNLKLSLEKSHAKAPKTSFKMSEVAQIKRMVEGHDGDVIDGSKGVLLAG